MLRIFTTTSNHEKKAINDKYIVSVEHFYENIYEVNTVNNETVHVYGESLESILDFLDKTDHRELEYKAD